jgi:hypothetical protein
LRTKIKEVATRLRHPLHGAEPTEDELLGPTNSGEYAYDHALSLVGEPADIPAKLRSSDMHKSRLASFFKSANASLHPTTHHADTAHAALPQGEPNQRPARANPADAFMRLEQRERAGASGAGEANEEEKAQAIRPVTLANCALPMRLTVQGEPVEIDTQVQIYATNAQLCHPFVSPVLAYLGGLCPLYVECGDNEVLRDEIIYL